MKKEFYYNEKNPKYSGMELNKSGYPVYKDSKKLVHRHYAEKYNLHRPLEKWEEVHHVDGDKLNLNPANLVVLSEEIHEKISKRLNKEVNLNKANALIIFLTLILFMGSNSHNWNTINRIIAILLIIGILVSQYQNIADIIMRKTKLYKVIDLSN